MQPTPTLSPTLTSSPRSRPVTRPMISGGTWENRVFPSLRAVQVGAHAAIHVWIDTSSGARRAAFEGPGAAAWCGIARRSRSSCWVLRGGEDTAYSRGRSMRRRAVRAATAPCGKKSRKGTKPCACPPPSLLLLLPLRSRVRAAVADHPAPAATPAPEPLPADADAAPNRSCGPRGRQTPCSRTPARRRGRHALQPSTAARCSSRAERQRRSARSFCRWRSDALRRGIDTAPAIVSQDAEPCTLRSHTRPALRAGAGAR